MGKKRQAPLAAEPHPYRLKTDGLFTFEGDLPAGYVNEMRAFFDRVLAAGQAVLDRGTWPLWEAIIKRDMAIVGRARASDPVKVQTSRDLWSVILPACANIERIAAAPAMETSAIKLVNKNRAKRAGSARTSITTDNLADLRKRCASKGWDVADLNSYKKEALAKAMGKSKHTINTYLRKIIIQDASS